MTAYLNALGVICALGRDKQQVAQNLFAGDCSGMRRESGWVAGRELPVAAVHGELAAIPAELADQSSLHVTNAQWYTADGRQISGRGLAPDIAVAEGDDPLAAALEFFYHFISSG